MTPDLHINEQELDERGFTELPSLASEQDLTEFEATIDEFCRAQLKERGITASRQDPFIDVMLADPTYRKYLFPLLPRFHVVQRISAEVGRLLTESGFLKRKNFRAPFIWPYIRADLPDEEEYLLSYHQDINSSLSTKAWRIWLPLRRVDRHHGSMELIVGSHKHGRRAHVGGRMPQAIIDPSQTPEHLHVCIEAPAGTGVLFYPDVLHRSVINRSSAVKFVLLIQVQDAAELRGPPAGATAAAGIAAPDWTEK
jgi:phytanoyl-CoA dioxygenase PhyH